MTKNCKNKLRGQHVFFGSIVSDKMSPTKYRSFKNQLKFKKKTQL